LKKDSRIMNWSQKIISQLPLKELWDDNGVLDSQKLRDLSATDIRQLLSTGTVRFVIANIGAKPEWIPENRCYQFWKDRVLPHLADSEKRVDLNDYPEQYCYFASEWSNNGPPIIALECHH
jgi:hypothetical protein